jgi:hypothetical protein
VGAVTVTELQNYLGKNLTAGELTSAAFVLDGLQGEMEAWLGRPIEQRSFTEDYDWTGAEDALYLRRSPVVSVESVTALTILTSGTVSDLIEVDYYTLTPWGITGLISALPSKYPYVLRVEYTAGYSLANPRYQGIKLAILKGAARWFFAGRSDVDDESAGGAIKRLATDGGYSVEFAQSSADQSEGSFSVGELKPLKRFRRRSIG